MTAELTLAPTAWLQCGVVRDFMAANRTDDGAQAALTDWIADAIYFATIDLSETAATLLRHGNYDFVTNSVVWDPAITDHNLPASLYRSGMPDW